MTGQSAPAAKRRLAVAEASVPMLARGARLRFDAMRQRWVLLVPERILAPDDTAIEVLKLCDGHRSVGDIVDVLAARYIAPRSQILGDTVELLQDLASSGFLIEGKEGRP